MTQFGHMKYLLFDLFIFFNTKGFIYFFNTKDARSWELQGNLSKYVSNKTTQVFFKRTQVYARRRSNTTGAWDLLSGKGKEVGNLQEGRKYHQQKAIRYRNKCCLTYQRRKYRSPSCNRYIIDRFSDGWKNRKP